MAFRWPRVSLRRLRPILFASAIIMTIIIYFRPASIQRFGIEAATPYQTRRDDITCPRSPLMKDVILVYRTGATEAPEKLPVHFKTILTCVPNFIIYSDMGEFVDGHKVRDVLKGMDETVKKMAPEFKLYDHLRTKGRESLDYQVMFGSDPSGASDNPGWELDKWKFLPMVDQALQKRPHGKWFVFVEPDTYLIWPSLLEYLSHFDSSKPYYLGKHRYANGVFAHSGSGFVLSRPALEKVSKYWREHKIEIDMATFYERTGDVVLGRALSDAGVSMFWAYPHLQGDSITAIDWAVEKVDKRAWCYAATTFHHMSPDEITTLWEFEQTWYRINPGGAPLLFRDIFNNLIRHRLRAERTGWDNMSIGREYSDEALARLSPNDLDNLSIVEQNAHISFEMCQATCKQQPRCIQFSFAPGRCSVSEELRLGHASETQCLEYSKTAGECIRATATTGKGDDIVRSGWIMARIPGHVNWLDSFCETVNSMWVLD